jgi:hypothetical protein
VARVDDRFDTDAPRTRNRRPYPEHLRPYERYDEPMLSAISELADSFTFDDLAAHVSQPGLRDVVPRWLASADWRRLVERREEAFGSPRTYAMTTRGRRRLAELRGMPA